MFGIQLVSSRIDWSIQKSPMLPVRNHGEWNFPGLAVCWVHLMWRKLLVQMVLALIFWSIVLMNCVIQSVYYFIKRARLECFHCLERFLVLLLFINAALTHNFIAQLLSFLHYPWYLKGLFIHYCINIFTLIFRLLNLGLSEASGHRTVELPWHSLLYKLWNVTRNVALCPWTFVEHFIVFSGVDYYNISGVWGWVFNVFISLWQKFISCCTWRVRNHLQLESLRVEYGLLYCLIYIFITFQLRLCNVLCCSTLMIQLSLRWYLQRSIGLLQLKRWMLIWLGSVHRVSCGILILSLWSITRFVCPLREILLYTHPYLWPLQEVDV